MHITSDDALTDVGMVREACTRMHEVDLVREMVHAAPEEATQVAVARAIASALAEPSRIPTDNCPYSIRAAIDCLLLVPQALACGTSTRAPVLHAIDVLQRYLKKAL